MFVKLFSQILDSSLAHDRNLRHFFMDILLLCDCEGNVIMTKEAIANRIRAPLEEVEWGLGELMKPDPNSLTPDHNGKRIVPLDGHAYGWRVVNYEKYRATKSTQQRREETAERVRRWRDKHRVKRGHETLKERNEVKREQESEAMAGVEKGTGQ